MNGRGLADDVDWTVMGTHRLAGYRRLRGRVRYRTSVSVPPLRP